MNRKIFILIVLASLLSACGGASEAILSSGINGNPVLWIKADDLTVGSGNPIAAWQDDSGQNNNLTQITVANQPTLVTNAINGHNAVRFSGAAQYMTGGNILGSLFATGSYTVFAVAISSGNPGWNYPAILSKGFNLTISADWLDSSANMETQVISSGASGERAVEASSVSFASWNLGTVTVDTGLSEADSIEFYDATVDTMGTGNVLVNGSAAYLDDGGSLSVGAGGSGGGSYFEGNIAELIVYDHALSTTDRHTMECSLLAKYGLSLGTLGC